MTYEIKTSKNVCYKCNAPPQLNATNRATKKVRLTAEKIESLQIYIHTIQSFILRVYYKMNKRQLRDRGFRRNSSLQAAWDISIAGTTGFM